MFSDSGANYDLSSIAAASPFVFPNGPNKFTFAFCKYVDGYYCQGQPSSSLQQDNPVGCMTSYGRAENFTAELLKEDVTAGISLIYKGGKVCNQYGSTGYTRFNIACDSSVAATPLRIIGLSAMPDGCGIEYEIVSPAGCGTVVPLLVRTLGVGWIVFLAVLFVSIVYLIGGIAYKRRKYGSSGIEAVPNIDFWRAAYGVVSAPFIWAADLCLFHGSRRRGHMLANPDDVYELAGDDIEATKL